MSNQPEEPKAERIIVDEDWKARVQAEKEAAAQAAKAGQAGPKGPLPPPTLSFLVTSLGMQAMMAMGLIPNPLDGKTEQDLHQAKHLIDTLDMLCEKTQGNRTAEETATLEDLLHQLRLGYVTIKEKAESEKP